MTPESAWPQSICIVGIPEVTTPFSVKIGERRVAFGYHPKWKDAFVQGCGPDLDRAKADGAKVQHKDWLA